MKSVAGPEVQQTPSMAHDTSSCMPPHPSEGGVKSFLGQGSLMNRIRSEVGFRKMAVNKDPY